MGCSTGLGCGTGLACAMRRICSRGASSAPKDAAAARNRGSVPDRAPQNTHTEPNPPEAGEEPIGAKRRRSEERRAWMWW